jgi:hypothetical protein
MKKTIERYIADQEKEESGDLPLLQENLKRFGQYFPKDENLETYQSQLTALLRRDAQKEQRLLQKELDNISSIEDPGQALAALNRFNRQYPQFATDAFVPRKIQELKQTILYGQLNRIQEQLHKDNLDAAGANLAQLKPGDLKEFPLLAQEYQNLSSLYSKRKNEQDRRKTEDYLTRLEKALEEENISAIQAFLLQKASFSLTAEEQRRFDKINRLSRIRSALLTYNQIISRDPLRGMDTLTEEEARETLSSLPLLLDDLPPDLSLKLRDKLLFYACASHIKLGEMEKAREIFQNLLREYPYSPYLPLAAKMVSD